MGRRESEVTMGERGIWGAPRKRMKEKLGMGSHREKDRWEKSNYAGCVHRDE